jgi:hypothetical protein
MQLLKEDMTPDMKKDIQESPRLMEPLVLSLDSPARGHLNDFAIELAAKSAGFRRSLPSGVAQTTGRIWCSSTITRRSKT